jgi:hypothetical protein
MRRCGDETIEATKKLRPGLQDAEELLSKL